MARRRTRKIGVSGKPSLPFRRSMRIKKKQNRDMADLLSGMTSIRIKSPKKKRARRTKAGKKAGRKKTRRMSLNRRSPRNNSIMSNGSVIQSPGRKYKPATMAEIEDLMNKLRM